MKTAVTMYNEYDFYIPPVFDGFDLMEKSYNEKIKQIVADARTDYLTAPDTKNTDEAVNSVSQIVFKTFIEKN